MSTTVAPELDFPCPSCPLDYQTPALSAERDLAPCSSCGREFGDEALHAHCDPDGVQRMCEQCEQAEWDASQEMAAEMGWQR